MSDDKLDLDDDEFLRELEAEFQTVEEVDHAPAEPEASDADALEVEASDPELTELADDAPEPEPEPESEREPEPAIVAVATNTIDEDEAEPHDDPLAPDAQAEDPLAQAIAEVPPQPEQTLDEDMVDQLQRMLDQVNAQGQGEAAAKSDELDATIAAAVKASDAELDDTTAEADELSLELSDLAAQIEAISGAPEPASTESPAVSDELTEDEIRQMTGGALATDEPPASPMDAAGTEVEAFEETPEPPPVAPVVSPDAPAPTREAIGQIDEFLAGQADTAVAGEFETVHDVMAAEQARDLALAKARDEEEAELAAAATEDESTAIDADASAQAEHSSADGDAQVLPGQSAATSTPVFNAAIAEAEPAKISLRARLARMVRTAHHVSVASLFTVCTIVNKPLRSSSESTRKMIGYAAIITIANAALLLAGKVIGIF